MDLRETISPMKARLRTRAKRAVPHLIVALAMTIRAQEAPPPVELPAIVIGSDRLAVDEQSFTGAATIIDAGERMEGRPRLTLNEALNRVPGVTVRSAQNFAQDTRLSVRGFGARSAFGIRGVRLFLEHLPLTLPDGQSTLDAVDMSLVDRLEVARGASSAQYGNASGGTIRLGLRPLPERTFLEAGLLAGSWGLERWQGATGSAWKDGAGEVAWSDLRLGGYRVNGNAEQQFLTVRMEQRVREKLQLRLLATHANAPWAGDPGGLTTAEVATDPRQAAPGNRLFQAGETLRETAIAMELNHETTTETQLSLSGFAATREFENRLPFRSGGVAAFDRVFTGGGLLLRHEPEDGTRFLVGLETAWQQDDRNRRNNDFGTAGALTLAQCEEVTQTGGFAEARIPIGPDLSLAAGLRGDHLAFDSADAFLVDGDDSGRLTFWEGAWSVGLNRRFGSSWSAFTHLASAYETPTTTELANPTGGGGFTAALEPQRSLTWETGLRGSTWENSLRGELVGFWIRTEDELIPFELPAFTGRRFYRNAGKTERQGMEASVEWRPEGDWLIGGVISWGQFRYRDHRSATGTDFSGHRLPGVPDWEGFVEIGWRPPEGFYAVMELDHTGSARADDANAVRAPGATLLNARSGWRRTWERWTLHGYLGLDNLTDATAQDNIRINAAAGRFFEPAPGASLFGGLSVRREF